MRFKLKPLAQGNSFEGKHSICKSAPLRWDYAAKCSSLQGGFSSQKKHLIPHNFTDRLQQCITTQRSQELSQMFWNASNYTCNHVVLYTTGKKQERLHVHIITSAKVWKTGPRFTPPIKIKPYTAIIFLQWPKSFASSCKTITDLKHNWKDA